MMMMMMMMIKSDVQRPVKVLIHYHALSCDMIRSVAMGAEDRL